MVSVLLATMDDIYLLYNSSRCAVALGVCFGFNSWGRISATDAAALERQGVRLSATDNPFLVILGEQRFTVFWRA